MDVTISSSEICVQRGESDLCLLQLPLQHLDVGIPRVQLISQLFHSGVARSLHKHDLLRFSKVGIPTNMTHGRRPADRCCRHKLNNYQQHDNNVRLKAVFTWSYAKDRWSEAKARQAQHRTAILDTITVLMVLLEACAIATGDHRGLEQGGKSGRGASWPDLAFTEPSMLACLPRHETGAAPCKGRLHHAATW